MTEREQRYFDWLQKVEPREEDTAAAFLEGYQAAGEMLVFGAHLKHRPGCKINPGGKIMSALGDPEPRPCSCGLDDHHRRHQGGRKMMSPGPSKSQWAMIQDVRNTLMVVSYLLAHDGVTPDEGEGAADWLAHELELQNAGVSGNRPAPSPVTWSDARLLLSSTMRAASDILDGA